MTCYFIIVLYRILSNVNVNLYNGFLFHNLTTNSNEIDGAFAAVITAYTCFIQATKTRIHLFNKVSAEWV